MQVKRYQASSMQEAIATVKQDLGEDAVILKTKTISRAGTFDLLKAGGVEVIAEVDVSTTDWVEFARKEDPVRYERIMNRDATERETRNAVSIRSWTPSEKISKRMVQNHKNTSGKSGGGPARETHVTEGTPKRIPNTGERSEARPERPGKAALSGEIEKVYFELIANGISRKVAGKLARYTQSRLPGDGQDERYVRNVMRRTIAEMINVSGPIRCKKGKSKVVAFVGQTGVGKTTTLAKLATKGKFFFDKNVSLISADTYRMSAIEHLNTFAGIAHLPISAVYSPNELRSVLAAQNGKDLVFIDTAGRSPRDERHIKELKGFMEEANPDEIHLVLPANNKYEDLMEAVRRFGLLPINGIVFSKVDETNSPGTILNVAAESPYPISYITNGQTIPDDIELASSRKLAAMMIKAA